MNEIIINTDELILEAQEAMAEMRKYQVGSEEWLRYSNAVDKMLNQLSKVSSMGESIAVQKMKVEADIQKAEAEYEKAKLEYKKARKDRCKDIGLSIFTAAAYAGVTFFSYYVENEELMTRAKELGRNCEEFGKKLLRK